MKNTEINTDLLGVGHREGMHDPWAGPGQWKALYPLPCPWNVYSALHPVGGAVSRIQPWGSRCVLDLLDCVCEWRPLYKLKILVSECQDLLLLWPPKKSLVCKFPCVLNLPPADLEWSFLHLSCRWYTEAYFRFHPGSSWGCKPTRILHAKAYKHTTEWLFYLPFQSAFLMYSYDT